MSGGMVIAGIFFNWTFYFLLLITLLLLAFVFGKEKITKMLTVLLIIYGGVVAAYFMWGLSILHKVLVVGVLIILILVMVLGYKKVKEFTESFL